MILADTSVWVEHLRHGSDKRLQALLEKDRVLTHAFVIGELALGNTRQETLALLQALPEAELASHAEVLAFIGKHALHGLGIGYVDAHLLAAARLTAAPLWTHDKRLHEAAAGLGLAYTP